MRDKIKLRYYNLFRRETYDKLANQVTEAIGWKTTQVTKPLLVDSLEEAIRNGDVRVHSEEALKEMKTFVRSEEEGKQGFGAEGENHDDRVIALGLALMGIRNLPKMKKPKTLAELKMDQYIAKIRQLRVFQSSLNINQEKGPSKK